MISTMSDLAMILCEKEGKKKQVNIAQMQEVLACLSDVMIRDPNAILVLLKAGKRRQE